MAETSKEGKLERLRAAYESSRLSRKLYELNVRILGGGAVAKANDEPPSATRRAVNKAPRSWARHRTAILQVLGEDHDPSVVVWAAAEHGDSAVAGVACLGRDAMAFAGSDLFLGGRAWKADYRDIQNIEIQRGPIKFINPLLVVSTPSTRETLRITSDDIDLFRRRAANPGFRRKGRHLTPGPIVGPCGPAAAPWGSPRPRTCL